MNTSLHAILLESSVEWCSSVDEVEFVHVIEIDGWFGAKWAGFSGKLLGAVGKHADIERGRLAVPPFVPSRVVDDRRLRLVDGEQVAVDARPMHRLQSSESATRRYFDAEYPSTAAIWHAVVDARIVLMCYHPAKQGETAVWYISLDSEDAIHVTDTVGIVPSTMFAAIENERDSRSIA